MASSPITSWQIDREKVKKVTDFIFLGSKITALCDFSHKVKRHLILGWKAMTDIHSVLQSRAITLLTKVHIVKATVFPAVMYSCESWTVKKTEHLRIDASELWYWRRLLTVPWTARRSNLSPWNQPWIFIWRTDAEAEAPMLWQPDVKCWLIRKDPDAGKDRRQEEKWTTENKMAG